MEKLGLVLWSLLERIHLPGYEPMTSNPEQSRLGENQAGKTNWQRWGPYLSERAWGTVREDYSADGDAWNYFPHDHARSRAYRWNEDGMGAFVMTSSTSAWPWPCGMQKTRSSKSACSA